MQVVITGDTRQFNRSLDQAGRHTEQFEGKIKGSAGRASQALKGLAVAGVGVATVALKKSADAAIEAERSQAKLVTQLRASGISYREHAKEINRVIQATSRLSGIDDEELQDSFTNIVRVTGDVNKSLRLTGLAADFARAKHIEVARAGEIVGKVAGGNTGILSRYGIVIDKNASSTEALAALQKRFAGQAEAYGKTTAGATSRANVALDNLGETVGGHLTPIIAKAANGFVDFIAAARRVAGPASSFGKAWRKGAKDTGEALSDAYGAVKRFVERNRALIGNIIGTISGLIRFVVGVFTLKWGKAWDGLKDAVVNSVQGIARTLRLTVVTLGKLAIGLGKAILRGIVSGLKSLGSAIKDAVVNGVKSGVNAAKGAIGGALDSINPFGDGIGRLAGKIGDGVGAAAPLFHSSGDLKGARPSLRPFANIGGFFGLGVSSGRRPGSITSSGNVSYHSTGEAIDEAGSPSGMLGYFNYLKKNYGSRLAELIYTPGGVGIKDGRPFRYTGSVAADHYDHVHVAFDSGRPGVGDGLGRFTATSYGPPWGGIQGSGTTATGVNLHNAPHRYGVAVDPSVIPLGTMLRISPNPFGYSGLFEAFDTGGAIKGHRLDFYDWRGRAAQMRWGSRSVSVSTAGGGSSRHGGGGGRSGRASRPRMTLGSVGGTTGGLGGNIVAGPNFEQSLSAVGLEKATATAKNDLAGLIGALTTEISLKKVRLRKIRKLLRRKRLKPATRAKLQDEAAELITDIADLSSTLREYNADAKGGAKTISAAEALDAGVAPEGQALNAAGTAVVDLPAAPEAPAVVDTSLADAIADLVAELKAVKDEQKRANDFASSVAGIASREAVKALADVISGQIYGPLRGRVGTAGNGTIAITP